MRVVDFIKEGNFHALKDGTERSGMLDPLFVSRHVSVYDDIYEGMAGRLVIIPNREAG